MRPCQLVMQCLAPRSAGSSSSFQMNESLSVLSWNVRGLNDAAHRELVRQITTGARPSIVCLQETKLSSFSRATLVDSLGPGYTGFHVLDATGTRGGILLAWDENSITASDLDCGQFTVSASIKVLQTDAAFKLTTCYGPADDRRKEDFLQEMLSLKPPVGSPWLILGDFNLIYKASDKNNLNLNRRLMGKFKRALDDCELLEICLQNRRFTWSNERENPTLVCLDRAFCNADWETSFPNYALHALSTGASDHCPILLSRQSTKPRRAVFRFENHWLYTQGFTEVVQLAWAKHQTGSAHTVLRKKLVETAKELRRWSKPLFSNARMQLLIANEVILRLEAAQDGRTLSPAEMALRADLKVRVLGLAALERSRRRQASRFSWIKAGDACTKFFHLKMSTRKRRKYISSLKRHDGSVIWSHEDKEGLLHDYFSSLLGTKVPRSRSFDWSRLGMSTIQQTVGTELDRPFTEEEIEAAIRAMPNEKAPGPDGFTTDFYKKCWPIIKQDILNAFHSIYIHHCGALEHINGAQVIPIPKTDVASEPKDFRPISLIHSFAKLFTKVLAIRMSDHIDKLIAPAQSAFIKKRCIQDNYFYVRGLARHYHRTRTPACLIKLDISKAFDTVSWEYLLEMLGQRGFSVRWTEWLAATLQSSSSSVMLNGCPGPKIKHMRGLRQGDPLSPYLFILAMDVLNRIFEIATEDGFLTPLKGRHAKLRLSLYADDAVIFTNPSRGDINVIMQIMEAFGDATGLRINMSKSTVAPIRCSGIDMAEVLRDFTGARVNFPVQYLGLPLTLGKIRLVHLQYILDRAKSKTAGWQGKLVSVAGRRELVRSVVSALPVYLITVIKPPKIFLKEFDKIRRHFLWAGDGQLTGGKCKVAWTKVCTPTANGGLGVKNLEFFSRSLRLRWMWFAWEDRERPWKGLPIPADNEDTHLFNAATRIELGNGHRASFWKSRWLQGEVPASLFPALFKHSTRKNRSVKEAMANNRWIADIDHNMTQEIIAEFVALWERLDSIVLSEDQEDRIVWLHTADGQYSAQSAYIMQFEGTTRCPTADLTWKTKAPPKCRFFCWLLLQNRVWTAARLQLREWPNEYFCQLCLRNLETASHLFIECPVARTIWERIALWSHAPCLSPENWTTTTSLRDWFLQLASHALANTAEGVKSMIMLVAWEIWRERNRRIFSNESRTVPRLLQAIWDEAELWAFTGNKGIQQLMQGRYSTQGLHDETHQIDSDPVGQYVISENVN